MSIHFFMESIDLLPGNYASPGSAPVLSPKAFSSIPMRCSMETYRLHSGVSGAKRKRRPGRSVPLPRPASSDREIVSEMQIAALDAGPEHHHGIIEQRRAALIETLQAVEEVRHLLHVPGDAACVLRLARRLFGVVRDGVEAALLPGGERVVLVGLRVRRS